MTGDKRRAAALAAAEQLGASKPLLAAFDAWDGGFLELVHRGDGAVVVTIGDAEIVVDDLTGAKLGLALDDAGVDFDQELPTARVSFEGDDA